MKDLQLVAGGLFPSGQVVATVMCNRSGCRKAVA